MSWHKTHRSLRSQLVNGVGLSAGRPGSNLGQRVDPQDFLLSSSSVAFGERRTKPCQSARIEVSGRRGETDDERGTAAVSFKCIVAKSLEGQSPRLAPSDDIDLTRAGRQANYHMESCRKSEDGRVRGVLGKARN